MRESFFYVVFRKDFRRISIQNIAGIIVCGSVVGASIVFGVELERNATPFYRLLFIIFTALYFIFEVSIEEMIGLALGQWLILCMLEVPVAMSFEHISIDSDPIDNGIMLIISICLWLYYFLIGRKLEPGLFQLPVKVWYLFDLILFILTAMMTFFSFIIVLESEKFSNQ